MYVLLLGTFIVSLNSCDKEEDPVKIAVGTISGVVTDGAGVPVPDVTITVSGVDEEDVTVTGGADA